jgi:alpha-glucan phosphorylase-like protein
MLQEIDPGRISAQWRDEAAALAERRREALARPQPAENPRVAYFCMEYGIHESLPIYSGGLGMLAGDHLRSAADLGLRLTAVGIFWQQGYFRQLISDGQQYAAYVANVPGRLPVEPVMDPEKPDERLRVQVPDGRRRIDLVAWRVRIGGVDLYLLDTNTPTNPAEARALTLRLYGGHTSERFRQEVVLGIGGIRLLSALGIQPEVFHMNEGHAAFLTLELWARDLQGGCDPEEGWQKVRQRCVFTTHTPVAAGHDRFDWATLNPSLGSWRRELDLQDGAFMDKGRVRPGDIDELLCMTVLGFRGSREINGVSALHGEVSRVMWKDLKLPIGHITNGVHPGAWLAPETEALWDRHLPGWRDRLEDREWWQRAEELPTEELLALREARRQRLVAFARQRLGRSVLDPDALTIGFARRFAPYKRGDLIFHDPPRLQSILESGAQIVYAGKAHPDDGGGKALVAEVLRWSRHPTFRDRVIFLPDYDMEVGRILSACTDVWLNNPRRPREASGTSGQKAALNGNPNCSILDGWWPEAWDGRNGWAIGTAGEIDESSAVEGSPEEKVQDAADAASLYSTLEREIVPAFCSPEAWGAIMAHTFATCVPLFNTHRMVRDYLTRMYRAPAAR